tara:strand:+ start:45 stop:551 length:507 start_codon:yes stop_codon:yes gene_type:complete
MILHYFSKKESSEQLSSEETYKSILKLSKLFLEENNFFKNKNYNTSFEIVSFFLILHIKLNISFKTTNYKNINEILMSVFINDLDESLRTKGVGDMSIGKHVKSYVKKFYFRLSKFPKESSNLSTQELEDYLNLFDFIEPNKVSLSALKFKEQCKIIENSYIKINSQN